MRHGRLWLFAPLLVVGAFALVSAGQPPKPAKPAAPPPAAEEPDDTDAEEAKDKAVAERFRKVLEGNPRRGTALDKLYGYHVERGTLDKLVAEYAARSAADPKDGTAWMIVGLIQAQRGQDGAAVAALTKAEETLTASALPSFYLGQVLVLVGRPEDAASAFERAILRKPNRNDLLDIYGSLGRVYQRAQKTDKALDVWTRLEAQYPDDARVQEQIATALADEGQYDQALPRLEKLAKLTDDKYRQTTFRMDAADIKVKLKKSTEALADFEKLLAELNPESWLYRDIRRRIEDVFLRNDDLAGLAKYYEKWLVANPTDVDAAARLSKNLVAQGRGPDARKWLEKGLEIAPSNKSLRQALIDQLASEGDFAGAAAQYEAMAKADPGNPDVLREWGKLLARDTAKPEAERKTAAAAVWRKILDKKPTDPVVTSQVADLHRLGGLTDEAVALYKKAIELAPKDPQYREYLGEYYHNLKKPGDALATWRPSAEGENRSGKNLARLAEVFAGFGYRKEAIDAMTQAISLEKDDFNLLTTYADLLHQEGRNEDALAQIDLAAKFTSNPDEVEQILSARIKIYQALDQLADRIDELQKDLAAGKNATGERFIVLSRFYEANKQPDKAVEAVVKATQLAPRSVPALTAAARIHEAGGNLEAAVDANKKLALIDRRFRTDYLTQVMKLEQRLGRRDAALAAGKELLASAPGNPDVYKTYSDLCFQLGEMEEGLEALRRSVRANPSEPGGLNTLANALSERGRQGEAIELLWRAFEKTNDLEGKLGVIDRLANLYLEANQFDKLLERLERERREADKTREYTLCIAQAYQSAGDLGTARQQLERLLTENTRDANLLGQLSQLSEQEGDLPSALKYQRQLAASATQNFDAQVRLAQLLLKSGEGEEAATVWVKSVAENNEPHRNLQAIDQLAATDRQDTALAILARMLANRPGQWELIYRQGALLMAKGKPDEAAARFTALLALKLPDDELGEVLLNQIKGKSVKKKADGAKGPPPPPQLMRVNKGVYEPGVPPLQRRTQSLYTIRQAVGMENRNYYRGQPANFYAPQDFGEARMAALGWLYEIGREKNAADAFVKPYKAALTAPKPDPRVLWDYYYLQSIRQDNRDLPEVAARLADGSDDPAAVLAFLTHAADRTGTPVEGMRYRRPRAAPTEADLTDKTPPLPPERLEGMIAAFKKLKKLRADWATPELASAVGTELKRAKRLPEEKAMYDELLAAATTTDKVSLALNAASEKDDLETVLRLYRKLETLQGPPKTAAAVAALPTRNNYWPLLQVMARRAEAKKPDDVLAVADVFLEMARRQNISAPKSFSMPTRGRQQQAGVNISVYAGWNQGSPNFNGQQVTFPTPNDYYDESMIAVLYNAHAMFKLADLQTDLHAHVKKQLAAAAGAEKIYLQLALAYLLWWAEEKDDALDQLQAAALSAAGDTKFTLEVAALREQNNEHAEALALLDSVTPTDHQVMQSREQSALRLAERTGNVARARQAAERLFGLRLDTETQLDLAAKMHRLGMHELAETVLARAQRQAGNKTGTLLQLMNQYQTQGQSEQAVTIARQLLRKSPSGGASRGQDDGDNVRNQAVGVLARSGQLKEIVARAEDQLKASPKSVQIHQTLLSYYQATADKDKQKATILKILELKPDDAKLRFSSAQALNGLGDKEAAMANYKLALKKDPSLFQNSYYELQRLFSEANKFEDLVAIVEDADMKKLTTQSYYIMSLIEPMMEKPKSRDLGMKLFKKAWAAFPAERPSMLSQLNREELWKLPELYDYAREAILPTSDSENLDPWGALGGLSRFLSTARKQHRIPEFKAQVEAKLKADPKWLAGRALLAVIDIQTGEKERGKKAWVELFSDDKLDIPAAARFSLAQELEYYAGVEVVVIPTLEKGLDDVLDDNDGNGDFSSSPARRLVWWYEQVGRTDDARKLLVRLSRVKPNNPGYDDSYMNYRRATDGIALANEMIRLNDPIEAIRVLQAVPSDPDSIKSMNRYGGQGLEQQLKDAVRLAMKAMTPETMARGTVAMLTPRPAETPKTRDGKPPVPTEDKNRPVLELGVALDSRDGATPVMRSAIATALTSLKGTPEALKLATERAAELVAKHPKDVSVRVAALLVALAADKPEPAAAAADALAKLLDESPLEVLPPEVKPNSRQRAVALLNVPVWLAARECLKRDPLAAVGAKLGAHALAGAKRQSDPKTAAAVLQEWGQIAAARKDLPAAEAKWSELVTWLMPKPTRKKATTAPTAATPAPATPATPAAAPKDEQSRGADDGDDYRGPTYFVQTTVPFSLPLPGVAPAKGVSNPVLSTEQFAQVYEVAKLAIANDLPAFSLKAVRDAVRPGPPVAPPNDDNRNGGNSYRQVTVGGTQYLVMDSSDRAGPITVDAALADLARRWAEKKVPPADVYAVVAEAVFPASRPAEVVLTFSSRPAGQVYVMASGGNNWTPITNPPPEVYNLGEGGQGTAGLLVSLAVESGRAPDLKAKLESRLGQPLGDVTARSLLFQLAVKQDDFPAAEAMLKSYAAKIDTDNSAATAGMVTTAATAALVKPALEASALALLNKQFAAAAKAKNTTTTSMLLNVLARYHEKGKRPAEVLKLLKVAEELAKAGPGEGNALLAGLGSFYLRAGAVEDALRNYGLHADATSAASADPSNRPYRREPGLAELPLLALKLRELPADKRYALLREWTLPTKGRKSLRYYVGQLPVNVPGEPFVAGPSFAPRQTLHTMPLLIDAAKEAGKFDELTADADRAFKDAATDADLFRVLVYAAQGKSGAIAADAKAYAEGLRKRMVPDAKNDDETVRSRYDNSRYRGETTFLVSEYLAARALAADPALKPVVAPLFDLMASRVRATQNWQQGQDVVEEVARQRLEKFKAPQALAGAAPSRWPDPIGHATWVSQDGVAGPAWTPENAYALFDAPLGGTFEFSVDVWAGTWSEGYAGYAGLVPEPNSRVQSSRVIVAHGENRGGVNRPKVDNVREENYNRVTLQVTPAKLTCLINGEFFYEDAARSQVSPWLMLYGAQGRRPAFRNPTITGTPEVLREVKLIDGPGLEGWFADFVGASLRDRIGRQDAEANGGKVRDNNGVLGEAVLPADTTVYDWTVKDGELHGRKLDAATVTPTPSKLGYLRTLKPGDIVEYEFYYEPGRVHAHPSVGPTVFLLDPAGVRWHYLSRSPGDWAGLAADNAKPVPGGVAVPLKPAAWNAVKLTAAGAAGETIKIEVNGTTVYDGPTHAGIDRCFGFFHFRDQTAARVRNAVLRGNWPKTVATADLAFAPAAPATPVVARARRELLGDKFFGGSIAEVLAAAKPLTPADRYAKLLAWVVPADEAGDFRLDAVNVPLDTLEPGTKAPPATGQRAFPGNATDAPCLQLVAAAKEAGKLDELMTRVAAAPAGDPAATQAKVALAALVALAKGDSAAAAKHLLALTADTKAMPPDAPANRRWPAYAATVAAVGVPEVRAAALELAAAMNQNLEDSIIQNKPFDGRDSWTRPYRAVRAALALTVEPAAELKHWASVPDANSWTRSQGMAKPVWAARPGDKGGRIVHYPGHNEDFLLLKTPIAGDFEVTCDLVVQGWNESHVRYGGYQFDLNDNRKAYKIHDTVMNAGREVVIRPPLPDLPKGLKWDSGNPNWFAFKMAVKDGVMTCSVDGRELHKERIGTTVDPWLALHTSGNNTGVVRNLKIAGTPTVPAKIDLLAQESLPGWRPYLGNPWVKRGEEMYGSGGKAVLPDGQKERRYFPEAAVYYQRPMLEDGTVEFEFYHEAGKAEVYPLLDRLVFVPAADGVKLHRLTDGPHEKSKVAFDNLTAEPAARKADTLTLKDRAWNRGTLTVKGDTVSLTINGVLAYERPIEPTNQRTFGFMNYTDRAEARVRNVVHTGQWAKQIPTNEQLLETVTK